MIEFVGRPSGDHESFCYDVDAETFIRLEGREPREAERSMFNEQEPPLYRYYPSCPFRGSAGNAPHRVRITKSVEGRKRVVTVEVEPVED